MSDLHYYPGFLQTDPFFPGRVNEYGCYFMAILAAFMNEFKLPSYTVTKEETLEILTECEKQNAIQDDCFVVRPSRVVDIISDSFAIATNGWNYTGVHSSAWQASEFPGGAQVLGKWRWKFGHFVLMDGIGRTRDNVLYDPLGKSYSVAKGKLESTRIYTHL